jgi:hypothetical protein
VLTQRAEQADGTPMNISCEPGVTRRQLVAAGGTAALASFLATSPVAQAITARPSHLRRSTYQPLTDRRFRGRPADVLTPASRKVFTLVEIADLPRARSLAKYRDSEHAFQLLFEGPPGGTQGTYVFAHPVMGIFRLFLVPVGGPSGVQYYEAIVDRLYGPTRKHPAPK